MSFVPLIDYLRWLCGSIVLQTQQAQGISLRHVCKDHGEVVIELAVAGRRQAIREISGMLATDVTRAFWIVEEHSEYLLTAWRRYDG